MMHTKDAIEWNYLVQFVFSSFAGLLFAVIVSIIFIAAPTAYPIRMFLATHCNNGFSDLFLKPFIAHAEKQSA